MATPENTRLGKGQGRIWIDGVEVGVTEGSVTFIPDAGSEVAALDLGEFPLGVKGAGIKSKFAPQLKFTTTNIDRSKIANYFNLKDTNGVITEPLETAYMRERLFYVKAETAHYEYDASAVSGESVGTGDGSTKTFAGTLAAIKDHVKRGTLSFTDGTETFSDNEDGTLTGDAGGTGTIDYYTGAYSITFNTAPTNGQGVTAAYTPIGIKYDLIEFPAAAFVGRPEEAYDPTGKTALTYTVEARWGEASTTGVGLFKITPTDVT